VAAPSTRQVEFPWHHHRRVGELAARHGIVLHELSPQTGSLEDAFLQATATAQQFASQPVRHPS